MKHGPDLARIAAAIGDPARAHMLTALMSGKALTSSELAGEGGVTAATASSHLARLAEAGLISVQNQGRHRYWRLAGEPVAQVLENLMGLAAQAGSMRTRPGPREPALRRARVCYDHLAGEYGVRLFGALVEKGVVVQSIDGVAPGEKAGSFLHSLGVDIKEGRRPMCRACLDWSERRTHLAGVLGAALLTRFFELGWARRDAYSRAVLFTADGERRFLLLTRPDDSGHPGDMRMVEAAVRKARV